MSGFPLLTILMVVPLVGAAVVALLPGASARLARPIALATSLVTLGLALLAWVPLLLAVGDVLVVHLLRHGQQACGGFRHGCGGGGACRGSGLDGCLLLGFLLLGKFRGLGLGFCLGAVFLLGLDGCRDLFHYRGRGGGARSFGPRWLPASGRVWYLAGVLVEGIRWTRR